MGKSDDQKARALRERRCLNPRPETVNCELFAGDDFFDPRDLLQVKYEMVRSVRTEKAPIRQAAQRFGFSRPSVYKALADFEDGGVAGLERTKPGPRRAHKLNETVMAFVRKLRSEETSMTLQETIDRIAAEFGVEVHLRSLQRALGRQKKRDTENR
jgi:transposase